MSEEARAEELMAKGPVWLVRRVMELEQYVDRIARLDPSIGLLDATAMVRDAEVLAAQSERSEI